MLHHIKELEKRTNKDRVEYVKEVLNNQGIEFKTQPFRFRVLKGENIIVNHFCQSETDKQLLLTAHTNKYFSSPGANDNASGVAVLLQIIENLQKRKNFENLGIKIVFFDHEDGLAVLDGSTYFSKHYDLSSISFLLNLDMVGAGDTVTISPNIKRYAENLYVKHILSTLKKRDIKLFSFNLPPLLVEDHLPFLWKNVPTISLNVMPARDQTYLKERIKSSWLSKFKEIMLVRFMRKRHPMFVMRHRHNELDTSEHIDPDSLKLCEEIVVDIIGFHLK